MVSRPRRCALVSTAAALLSLAIPGSVARADDGAAAQILWEEAKAHAQEGDFEAACPKFAESHRLDPQLGTLMNLADCYARIGKVASSWARFVEAAEMAKARQDPRQEEARRRADELEPKLVRLEVVVEQPVEGMTVRRGDDTIAEAMWGSAVPVDPGTYEVVAEADGYLPYRKEVDVTEEGSTIELAIPPLTPAPEEEKSPERGGGAGGDGSAMSTGLLVSGVVAASLGAVGIGVGTAFLVIAKGKDDDSLAFCQPDDPTLCSQQGLDLRDDARSSQTIGIAGLVTGGVLGVTGAALIVAASLTGDDGQSDVGVVPWASPQGAGLVTTLRF